MPPRERLQGLQAWLKGLISEKEESGLIMHTGW
jgi:hypothetical protein